MFNTVVLRSTDMNVFGPHFYHNQDTESEKKYCFVYQLMALLCLFYFLDIYRRIFRLLYWCDSTLEALRYGGPLPYPHRCSSAMSPLGVAGKESNSEPTLRQTGALTI